MEDFLRKRNVIEDSLLKMREDGIDETVVAAMTTDQLTKYIPRYGDCLAAIAFAKQSLVLDDEPNSSFKRKSSLRDRLANKLYGKRKPDEHTRRSVPQEGNKNAKKLSKKMK